MKRRIFNHPTLWLAVGAASVLYLSGCSSGEVKAKAPPVGAKANAEGRPPWDWDKYQLSSRMRLGTMPCQLQPKSTIQVYSPYLGTLRVYVDEVQSDQSEGYLWAEFEPDIFASEEKWLTEAKKRLEERERVQMEIEVPRKKLALERQLEEAERQAAYARILATNKAWADVALTLPGGSAPIRPDALEKTEMELKLVAQQMDMILETNLTALNLDLGLQRLDWERRNLEFQKRKDQSQFRMPFAGKLTVSLPLSKGVTEYSVDSGQELGVVRDFSAIRVRVPIGNSSWSAIPGEKLTAIVRVPSGPALEANFAYHKIEKNQNREESVYYFEIPGDRSVLAGRMVGTHVSCELWANLDEPARVVPKLALVLHDPEAFGERSWSEAVKKLFPGARVLAEGQTDLGIVLPKTMKVSQLSQ